MANDTSVVKIKDTLQLPITVDISKICSVRKHDRFKKQNLNKIEEEGLDKPIVLVPNIYGNYMQIKDERKDCMQTWLKSFPFLAYTGNETITIARKLKYDRYLLIKWLDGLKINFFHKIFLSLFARIQYILYYKEIKIGIKFIDYQLILIRSYIQYFRAKFY